MDLYWKALDRIVIWRPNWDKIILHLLGVFSVFRWIRVVLEGNRHPMLKWPAIYLPYFYGKPMDGGVWLLLFSIMFVGSIIALIYTREGGLMKHPDDSRTTISVVIFWVMALGAIGLLWQPVSLDLLGIITLNW